ncbi:hypothetical protein [Haloechinothrix salitolerans]|uniref:Uncharacterized protein n=1 Tax=Haloechinothrix salitolerans TaxID=926830 RepID=A0ABW2CAS3_9PSEU
MSDRYIHLPPEQPPDHAPGWVERVCSRCGDVALTWRGNCVLGCCGCDTSRVALLPVDLAADLHLSARDRARLEFILRHLDHEASVFTSAAHHLKELMPDAA